MSEVKTTEKQPNYKMRRAMAAAGFLLAAGAGAKLLSAETPSHNQAETEIMREAYLNPEKRKLEFENKTYVLKEGVKVRTTPDIPHDSEFAKPSDENVQRQVKKGEVIIFEKPVTYQDDNGETWIGAVSIDNANNEPKGPEAVADTMVWANITKLKNQTNSEGKSFYDTYGEEYDPDPIHVKSDVMLDVGDEGRITYDSHTIATAHRIADDRVSDFISSVEA